MAEILPFPKSPTARDALDQAIEANLDQVIVLGKKDGVPYIGICIGEGIWFLGLLEMGKEAKRVGEL